MIKIKEAIVVEGRYDKNALSQIVDAPILETSGFSIMKDKQQLKLLRKVAANRGVIILTDSDGAGFVIRNYLKGAIPSAQLKHAYIPDIQGKERRKSAPGKEGKLGVEGMRPEVIIDAIRKAGATIEGESTSRTVGAISKQDFMELGLSGGVNSKEKRQLLLKKLELPEHTSSNALLQAINLLMDIDELKELLGANND